MSVRAPAGPDYWAVLGLQPGADGAALKRAFRAQARRYHPDLNGNDPVAEEQFKLVNEAYAVLSDPRRRQAWERGDGPGPGASGDPFATGFPHFDDYLAELFGPRRRDRSGADPVDRSGPEATSAAGREDPSSAGGPVTPSPPPPPPVQASGDLETMVDLTPEQALEGVRLELELPGGLVVEVWTPPLAGDGWRLRLEAVAPGGGDHFLHLRVRTPEGLRIDGLRVMFPLELSPAEAALGCRVVVPTLNGPVKLTVPPCSSSGRLLRLRGRGLAWGEQRGDQLVEVRIVLPDQLDGAEEALYARLLELADLASSEAEEPAGRR